MTYRGHAVLETLIRAYFSPAHSTGQRFIYSGSQDGTVYTWDVVTGQLVNTLQAHHAPVRDCSWHPYEPQLTTVSWDRTVVTWGVGGQGGVVSGWGVGEGRRKGEDEPRLTRHTRGHYYY
jgi:WD repeat-containing protein 23